VSRGAGEVSGFPTSHFRLDTLGSDCAKQSQFRVAGGRQGTRKMKTKPIFGRRAVKYCLTAPLRTHKQSQFRLRAGVSSFQFEASSGNNQAAGFPTSHFKPETSRSDYEKQSQSPGQRLPLKYEARNPKSETNPKYPIGNDQNAAARHRARLGFLVLVLRACFGFRHSGFELAPAGKWGC